MTKWRPDLKRWYRELKSVRRFVAPMGTIELEPTKIVGGEYGYVTFTLTYRTTGGAVCNTGQYKLDRGDSLRIPWVTTVEDGET